MNIAAYLARIDVQRPAAANLDALRTLQAAHLATVPFENLSVHLGEPIALDPAALEDKVVRRRRGGFCYELNGLFAVLLRELGFRVTLLAARAYLPSDQLGPPFDHLALRVDLDEPWLVDVGFGAFSQFPLRLFAPDPQADPDGEFLLLDQPDGEVQVCRDGKPAYLLELRARELADFTPTCWWQSTSPDSNFTKGLTCSLRTDTGRITLSGDRLIETVDGERRERILPEPEILDIYRKHFGIELERVPSLAAGS
ncbi:N-hydroxyarylamine O-acetyltransferase [Amycolatopsis marina]|uniref:N-hydroxyarylamine O-acetyltransferase n=1 Tax=Amycolatopsis marina TaxID=490629 RepID=A0A1I1CNM2_9PSEU|nr:arylamine N-acetyltransferase [Amycolatopsis marina]SFB62210.1 N-hydroxyarylamine O-acetyltransferase [Amycolatopsis marina]